MEQKLQLADDAWNIKKPVKTSKPCTVNIEWRNTDKFLNARESVQNFLTDTLNYDLKKVVWAFKEKKIAVRFKYEYQDKKGQRYLANRNENWDLDANGIKQKKFVGISDIKID